jgi:DNA/RNA-binding domain of Phe-tRNA-synthetase-like protein
VIELALAEGWVESELAEEFPDLHLTYAPIAARPQPSPPEVRERLRALADRYTGAKVVHMRQDAIPWAYRVFSRQVGVDPDSDRTPVEALAVERLRHGGLRSENLVDDALTIAVAETGVPVFVLDADKLEGELGLRLARAGEWLSERRALVARQLVVADETRPLALLMGEVSIRAAVTAETRHMLMCALRVKGVPQIVAEEALWLLAETLSDTAEQGVS